MVQGGQECVGVWRQVHSGSVRLQVEDCANERGVLMAEAIVLLSGPGTGLDIVDAADIPSPGGFLGLGRLAWRAVGMEWDAPALQTWHIGPSLCG
jgi:hypothetical protein